MAATAFKAQLLFELYSARQPLSLAEFAAELDANGIAVSLGTLKRYSAKFGWQEALVSRAERRGTQLSNEGLRAWHEHTERTGQLGRGLQGVAGVGLRALANHPDRLARELNPVAIARLAEAGSRLAGEAAAFAPTYDALLVRVTNWLLPRIVQVFGEASVLATHEDRTRAFALGVDALIDELARMEDAE